MALHPDFPTSPYAPLIPEHRWFPAAEELRNTAYEKLLPPLSRLRQWSEAATAASALESGPAYKFVYVDRQGYERNPPKNFEGLVSAFREYQEK